MSLFFRHLMSYILVFVIPLLILGFFSYSHITAIVTENFNRSKVDAMTLIKDQLDLKMADVINISQQLSTNYDLKPHAMNTFNGFYFSAQRLNYPSANNFFYDIFYYVRDGDFLFSSTGTYKLPLFFNQIFTYEQMNYSEFFDFVNHSRTRVIRGSEKVNINNHDSKHFLTIAMPIPLNSSRPYGTALFLIEEDKMRGMLRSIIHDPDGDVLIYNEHGEVLLTLSDRSRSVSDEVWNHINERSDRANIELNVEQTDYLITSVHSNYTNWKLTILTPKKHLIDPIRAMQLTYLKWFSIILIIGSMAIYFMMYVNYNPLQRLIAYTEEIWTQRQNRRYRGLETVFAAIQDMNSTSSQLTTKVNENREAVLQFSFLQLIKGVEEEIQSAVTRLTEHEFPVAASSFYVAIVETEREQFVPTIWSFFTALLKDETAVFQVETTDPRRIVWISAYESDEQLETWQSALNDIHDQLEIDMAIGIGKPVEKLQLISKSYMEAHNALQHKLLLGMNRVIRFKDVHKEHHQLDVKPLYHLETLKSYIREGLPDKMVEISAPLADEVESSSPNLFVAKCLVIEILQSIVRGMKQTAPAYVLKHPDVLTLSNYNRMKDLQLLVKNMIFHAAGYLSDISKHREIKLQRMLQYLDSQITNPQFSLHLVAEKFACSSKHAHQYFKQHMGVSIMEYVHSQRMEKVKLLLQNQELRIQDIIYSVGYNDSSSFIRKFKKTVGCTPGEYRRTHISNMN